MCLALLPRAPQFWIKMMNYAPPPMHFRQTAQEKLHMEAANRQPCILLAGVAKSAHNILPRALPFRGATATAAPEKL